MVRQIFMLPFALIASAALLGGCSECPEGQNSDSLFCHAPEALACESDEVCAEGLICLEELCVAPSCGDGVISGDESCDDGNVDDGDCCASDCSLEDGWVWDEGAGACAALCGDGLVTGAEQCDDGNTDSGDCCDLRCNLEAGWFWAEGRCEPSQLYLEVGIPTNFGDGTGILPLTLRRENDWSVAERLDYTVVGGTAVAGEHFLPAEGVVVFAAGERTATLTIHLVSNGVYDLGRTVRLSLTDIDGVLAHSETISLPDLDERPTISMSSSEVTVDEDVGQVSLSVVRSGETTVASTVRYRTVDGTALSPQDYEAASGELTIGASEAVATIDVVVVDDALYEPDQRFAVVLEESANAYLGDLSATEVIIRAVGSGGDPEPVLNALDVTVPQGATEAVVTVELSGAAEADLAFSWETVNGTAVAGVDYEAVSNTSMIPGGSLTTELHIPVLEPLPRLSLGSPTFEVDLSVDGVTAGEAAQVTLADGLFRLLGREAADGLSLRGGTSVGDVNGDGELDLVATSRYGDYSVGEEGVGYVLFGGAGLRGRVVNLRDTALDGSQGFVIDRVTTDSAERVSGSLGDLNGDGLADVASVTDPTTGLLSLGSRAHRASYSRTDTDGVRVAALTGAGPTGSWATLGAVDFNGDGFTDAFMGGQNSGLAGGVTHGLSLWLGRVSFDAAVPVDGSMEIGIGTCGAVTPTNFSSPGGWGDFNGDGFPDLAASFGCLQEGELIRYRTLLLFGNEAGALPVDMASVREGEGVVLSTDVHRGVLPNTQQGDFNGDGIDDALLLSDGRGELFVVFGATEPMPAERLLTTPMPLGTGVVIQSGGLLSSDRAETLAFGDLNADGFDDIAVSRTDDQGVMIIFGRAGGSGLIDVSVDPAVLSLAGSSALDRPRDLSVADIDGDGLGDLLIGAAMADTISGVDSGAGLVVFGDRIFDEAALDVVLDGEGADTLEGSPGADRIVAGRGDDLIDTGGGGDAVYAGQGDDLIMIMDGTFRRIHGGSGFDTLALEASGLTLDLRAIGRSRIQEIEAFDLTAPGLQRLIFGQGDLATLSTTSREVFVDGGAEDRISLEGAFIDLGDVDGDGYAEYRLGAMTVHVSRSIVDAGGVTLL